MHLAAASGEEDAVQGEAAALVGEEVDPAVREGQEQGQAMDSPVALTAVIDADNASELDVQGQHQLVQVEAFAVEVAASQEVDALVEEVVLPPEEELRAMD